MKEPTPRELFEGSQPPNRMLLLHLHRLLHNPKHGLEAQAALQRRILRKVGKLMTIADDIKAALADISAETTAETDLVTAIDVKITGLGVQITALQQQIADLIAAGNGGLTAADVAEVQASIAALKTGTDAVKAKLEITANTAVDPNA